MQDQRQSVTSVVKPEVKTEDIYSSQGGFNNNRNNFRGQGRGSNRGGFDNRVRGSGGRGGNSFRGRGTTRGRGGRVWRGSSQRQNPIDKDGNVTKCLFCGSERHYIDKCQLRQEAEAAENSTEKPTLHLTDQENESSLIAEEVTFLAQF